MVAEPRLVLPARLEAVRRTGLLGTGAEEPFDRLARLAAELLGTPFAFVTIVDERRSFWKSCVGVASADPAERQNAAGDSLCQYVIETDQPVIIGDARLNPMTARNPSIESMGVIAWAGFPVRSPDGHVLGTFCVVDTKPRVWREDQVRILEVLAYAASGEVALRMQADEARRVAADSALLAATLQESLLPGRLPDVEGLDVAATYVPGGTGVEVMGDFYDLVPNPAGWSVFAGDVAGKGAVAARTTALARYTLRASALRQSSPALVLTDLDRALRQWFDDAKTVGFVTVACAALRREGGRFRVRLSLAGHPHGYIRRADGEVQALGEPGTLLGCLPKLSLSVQESLLGPGDTLILYTDGLTEAHNSAGEMLGDAGLRRLVASLDSSGATGLTHQLRDRVMAYADGNAHDDIAVIAVQVIGESSG
jgi:sigma-B regulation protein RsbU (phosphoserine phosphatase)